MSLIGFQSKSLSLLWKGSRDGFGAATFHSLCDGKPSTLTVVRSTTGYIFGGYTQAPWTSHFIRKRDPTAFLFSLTNPKNMPLKLNIGEVCTGAVFHASNCGPIFGDGYDLYISDLSNANNCSSVRSESYDLPNGLSGEEGGKFIHGGSTHNFQTVEVEVYQVAF